MTRDNLAGVRLMLAPKSIAVIGASRRPGTIGRRIVQNLIHHEFNGSVYPVNPLAESVCSVRAHPTIADVPEPVDIAVIAVPAPRVLEVAEACGHAGVEGIVVISAGFAETGSDGAAREDALLEIVRRFGMRMVGPNCMGILNADPAVSMNATFADAMPAFGPAAFVSQSGALGVSVLDYAREYRIGISQFVSVGNKSDVSGNDLLLVWEQDPTVRVILMYVEAFGDPARFLELAGRITKQKPIVVVKAGRTRSGARAASSHTGALAASDAAVDALLAQAGVLRAETIEELFEITIALGSRALPRSRRTAVLTNGGGPGILAADALESFGLEVANLSSATVDAIRPLLPREASLRNPVDMIASATPAAYRRALTALLADRGIDAVIPIFVPPFGVRQHDVVDAIAGAAATAPEKPVIAVLMGREGLPEGRTDLHAIGIPTFVFPESAARALAVLHRHAEWVARPTSSRRPILGADRGAAASILETAAAECRDHLTPCEAFAVLRAYGIPVAAGRLVTTPDEAEMASQFYEGPLAVKVVSPDIVHKTDVGGVLLNVAPSELRAAFDEVTKRVAQRSPNARIEGMFIQEMRGDGLETIVGLSRDPSFGPLIMFGLGGVFVEAAADVVFRIAPLDDRLVDEMLHGIRVSRLLDGWRGAPAVDRAAIASVILRVSQIAIDHPTISEIDINPLVARSDGVTAIDVRIRLQPSARDARAESSGSS